MSNDLKMILGFFAAVLLIAGTIGFFTNLSNQAEAKQMQACVSQPGKYWIVSPENYRKMECVDSVPADRD